MLVAYGVAAELNFHTNEPSPHFAALCLERGVKLTFGGDSHAMWEVGAMWPHVRLLQEVGVTPAELSRVLLWLDEAPHRWKTGDSHRFRR
jgi:histidinol phosphatase-like PHP family hydrolase